MIKTKNEREEKEMKELNRKHYYELLCAELANNFSIGRTQRDTYNLRLLFSFLVEV